MTTDRATSGVPQIRALVADDPRTAALPEDIREACVSVLENAVGTLVQHAELVQAERDRYRLALVWIGDAPSGVWGSKARDALRGDGAR